MSAMPDPMPKLDRRSDASYLDFVEGFREYILGKGADFEERLNAALLAEGERRGTPMQDKLEVRRFLQSLPIGQLRDRLARVPAAIHRLKGFVHLADCGETRLVQLVGGRVELTPCAPPQQQSSQSALVAIWPRGAADRAELDRIFASR